MNDIIGVKSGDTVYLIEFNSIRNMRYVEKPPNSWEFVILAEHIVDVVDGTGVTVCGRDDLLFSLASGIQKFVIYRRKIVLNVPQDELDKWKFSQL